MMTADRTSVRRRLAVRRRSNRPPWGRRKRGHSAIVAPLAASVFVTLAATAVVGLGVALVRDERDRRSALARRARRFALAPRERPADGLRRMALGQLDLAIELLEGGGGEAQTAAAVHETRKALKRLRALMRTLRPELGEEAFERENAVLRDCARKLAGARDAEVIVGTLDGLLARHPKQLAQLPALRQLRAQLAAERDLIARRTMADPGARSEISGRLRDVRASVGEWSLGGDGMAAAEPGLERLYRQGRRRLARARRRGADGRELHLWRKRVKDLRYAAEMLERRGAGGRAQAGWIHKLAARADELGEVLGEEHDLALLAERVRGAREPFADDRRARKTLLKVIRRRRRRLRERALRKGERIFRRSPKQFIARVRAAYARQKYVLGGEESSA